MEIFKLFGSIFVDSKQAEESISSTDKKADSLGGKLSSMVGTAAKWGAGILLGAGAAAGGLLAMADKTMSTAASMKKLSVATQLSINDTQEWAYIFQKTGSSTEVMQNAINKLGLTMGKADDESKRATEAFKNLGISVTDAGGKLKPTGTLFEEAVTKLSGMKDITERNILAQRLFGGSYTELLPILNRGSAGLDDLKKRAHDLGLVMSDDGVLASAKYKKAMGDLKEQFGSLGAKLTVELIPYFSKFADWIASNIPTIQKVTKIAFDNIISLVDTVAKFINNNLAPAFTKLMDWIQPNIPKIQTFVVTAFAEIKTALNYIPTIVQSLINWFEKYRLILIPLGAGIGAVTTLFGLYALGLGAVTLATTTWTTVTTLATTVGTAFATVMAFITSPIGLVVIAIGLLVAAGVALYQNWDTIKAKATEIFTAIKDWIDTKITEISTIFNNAITSFETAGSNMFNALWDGIKSVWTSISSYISEKVSWVADKLSFWKSSSSSMSSDSGRLEARASGGSINAGQTYLVGEQGPEIFTSSQNGTIIPNHKISSGSSAGQSINIVITGNSMMNSNDADKLGDLLVRRLKTLGVT